CNEIEIGFQEIKLFESLGSAPCEIPDSKAYGFTRDPATAIKQYQDGSFRIAMEDNIDDFADFNFDFEFLKNFPPQAIARILVVCEFTAGNLPLQAAMGFGRALRDEQPPILFNQPG